MKKKILGIITFLAMFVICSVGLFACNQNEEPTLGHTHTYSSEWTYDDTHHWHAATCEHTTEIKDKAEHNFINGVCACGKKEPTPEHTHTYSNEWSYNETHHWHAATCEHTTEIKDKAEHNFINGVCECGKEEPTPGHTHTYSSEWTYDETYHWHVATCEHTTEIKDKAEHNYVGNVCEVCGELKSSEGLEYRLINNGTEYEVIGIGECEDFKIIIPQTYKGKKVTRIGEKAFKDCDKITNVEMPESVKSIGEYSFSNCSSLTLISVSEELNEIGKKAFYNCVLLEKIVIPNNVSIINDYVFMNCYSLANVEMSENVKSIGEYSFSNCRSLTLISLPKELNEIGRMAFYNCVLLEKIVIPNNVSIINDYVFMDCCSLINVEMSNNVREIGEGAFRCCRSLKNITLPDNISVIEKMVFYGCSSLETIYLPKNLETVGAYSFYNCDSIVNLEIPSKVTTLDKFSFSSCNSLISLILGDSVVAIGECAFSDCCSLASVTVGSRVSNVGKEAFKGCYILVDIINKSDLRIIQNKEENGYLGMYALSIRKSGESNVYQKDKYLFYVYDNVNYLLGYYGHDKDLILPDNFNGQSYDIYKKAFFYNEDILSVKILGKVDLIEGGAFSYCKSLVTVVIGDKSREIGRRAFADCRSLISVTIGTNMVEIGSSAFDSCSKLLEVINKSKIRINRQSGHGYLGAAINIKTTGTSDIVNQNDFLFYTINNVNYLVGYIGNDTELTLPDSYNGQSYEIYKYAFFTNEIIEKVYISSGITKIGICAFYQCIYLTEVTISNSVTDIAGNAFYGCNQLRSIVIPKNVENIGNGAFSGCTNLIEVINLSELNITKGSSNNGDVGYYALNVKQSGESDIVNLDGYLFYSYDSKNYLIGYEGVDIELFLPRDYNGESYEIYKGAFHKNNRIISVDTGGATAFGLGAFHHCLFLQSVEISNIVDNINNNVFASCPSLQDIIIPDSVTTIGSRAFASCSSLQVIDMPNSITSMGYEAFDGCSKLQYNEYDNGLYLGNDNNKYLVLVRAKNTAITSCVINDNCKVIGDCAFRSCSSLTTVTIGNSVTTVGNQAFSGCSSLTNITIGSSVTTIGNSAFSSCSSLITVTIGNGTTTIGYEVFQYCSSLANVRIGNSVTTIGYKAFGGCSSLQSINVDENNKNYKSINGNLYSKDGKTLIQYALGKQDRSFTTPDSVTNIGNYAFEGCSSLTSVTIGNSVTTIGERAFYNCSSLQSVTIGNSVTTIGEYAFYNCSSLTSVTIGNSVTTIDRYAFCYCPKLQSVKIGNNVTSIGNEAFFGCSSLKSITFSDSSNWYRTDSPTNMQNKTGGTLTNLSNPTQNVTYFTSTYDDYYWYKK